MRRPHPHFGRSSLVVLWLSVVSAGCSSSPAPAADRGSLPDEGALAPDPRPVPRASARVQEGEQRLQAGDAAGARALFEQAIAEAPDDPRAHLDLGLALELLGDAAGAEQSYRKAIELQPDLAEALNNLGVLLRERGELDEAIGFLRQAAEKNPRSASARLNLGLALEDKGELPGAEQAYREAIGLDGKLVIARVNLGLLLVGREDLAGGKAELEAALAGAQGNRGLLLAIGNGLRRAGDAQGALSAMEGAVAADDEVTPALLSELALSQRAADQRDAALATLERALSLDAKYATAHYLLGNMLAGDKRFAEAKKHYKQYLKLEPSGPHAERAQERLRMIDKLK